MTRVLKQASCSPHIEVEGSVCAFPLFPRQSEIARMILQCRLLAQRRRVGQCGKSAAIWGTPVMPPT